MPLFRVRLAYDGTDFLGWQAQAPGKGRTVQGVLEGALGRLAGGAPVRVVGAGRTDTGVHALGQVAAFDLPRSLSPEALVRALNGLLPEDVRVLDASEAALGFHPRKHARSKLYRYVLDLGPVQLPTRRRFAAHLATPLDPGLVRRAAALYVGRHDFAAVASSGSSVKTTVRTVTRSEVRFERQGAQHEAAEEEPLPSVGDATRAAPATMVYEVEADGFLRKMVRSLVGGLIAAGSRAVSVDDLKSALEARDRRGWPAPAPACGLTLVSLSYPATAPGLE